MLTHLDLHRHVTHARSGDVVTRDAGAAPAVGDDVAAGRATAASAHTTGLAPGPDAGPALPPERMALHLRGPREWWRQWTTLVGVAVHSVSDRLREELSRQGDARGTAGAAPVGPPYPLDPYAGVVARSGGRADREGAARPRAVLTARPGRRADDLGDERLHGTADLRPPRDGG
jgi:hypothetical protein